MAACTRPTPTTSAPTCSGISCETGESGYTEPAAPDVGPPLNRTWPRPFSGGCMRRVALLLFLVISVSLAMSGVSHVRRASAQSKPETTPMQTPPKTTAPPPGGMTPPPAGNMAPPPGMPPSDHVMPPFVFNQAHADSQVAEMLEHIKGKEDMPAESVYKNIKIFKGMPAKRIPPMMVMNFSRSLGMRCSGCHKRGDFA